MAERGARPTPPGDAGKARRLEEMLRVDHAGEYGAVAIYRGQRAVFAKVARKRRVDRQLAGMAADEQAHLDAFDQLLLSRRVRPTALAPAWSLAGYALGAATALLGERAAHACTEAVETVIGEHYGDQVKELEGFGETELAERLSGYRDEELAHRDLAVAEGAKDAVGYPVLSRMIALGCRAAIKISEKF